MKKKHQADREEERADIERMILEFYRRPAPSDFRRMDELNDAGISWRYYANDGDEECLHGAPRHIRFEVLSL